jgi:hypothetical protein
VNVETAMDVAGEPSAMLMGNERVEDAGRLDRAKGAVNDAITRLVVFGDSARASAFERRDAPSSS